ncbi:MAG: hypothetical protein ACT4QD_22135 [Acidobacteriota bacterium]
MDVKRVFIALVVGAAVLYATGYLIFDVLFSSFYAANAGSATGVNRDGQLVWAMALANFGYASLIIFAMGRRERDVSIGRGAITGAVVGSLMWFTVDFVFYGSTNLANRARTLVDPMLEFVHGGIGGAVIAAVSRKSGPSGGTAV